MVSSHYYLINKNNMELVFFFTLMLHKNIHVCFQFLKINNTFILYFIYFYLDDVLYCGEVWISLCIPFIIPSISSLVFLALPITFVPTNIWIPFNFLMLNWNYYRNKHSFFGQKSFFLLIGIWKFRWKNRHI